MLVFGHKEIRRQFLREVGPKTPDEVMAAAQARRTVPEAEFTDEEEDALAYVQNVMDH
jgi:hypothetical protein